MSQAVKGNQIEKRIIHTIYIIGSKKVILDYDLANLYGVET